MSFDGNSEQKDGLELLKPDAKIVSGSLDILSKYKDDLEILVAGRDAIKQSLKNNNVDNEEINRKLKKLDESIEKLKQLIKNFEKEHPGAAS